MRYHILHRPWRMRRLFYFMMLPEIICIVALLVLFAKAQPASFRTLLWQIGSDHGFNSSPNIILYAYANHVPLPDIPFVWSQTLTDLNVAVSVLSLFILLTKMIALIMHVFFPIIGFVASFALTALFATSVYGQAGPDYADPRHPSPVAWYIAKGCQYAKEAGAVSDCMMAKGAFAATVVMLAVHVVNLGFAVWALLPNKQLDVEMEGDSDSEDNFPPASSKAWEMQPRPLASPRMATMSGGASGMASPFTPRTQAFNALDRRLPLRTE
ncbi:hypothetical protein SPI_08476 [Niveomyces insectorum RCEF 264]|uniref:Uncharacterized protein n=1 Tax=Niveomyces insectorum RCEF 264 TaxID=1081102 RepID=A0A167N055_9HYPO|nr:hypothetical protein SPI_08476 [Niveomyces insectorum RCEF 264]